MNHRNSRPQAYYGVDIGVLMVNTEFRRFPGDVGNALTWNFPIQYKVVQEAKATSMTCLQEVSLLDEFKAAGRELVNEGVAAISTSCGFLALYQREMADHCQVPVATSSLLQVALVQQLLPAGQTVGIMTFSAETLQASYLEAVGAPTGSPIIGMAADSEFVRSIRAGDRSVPRSVLEAEVLATAQRLVERNPEIGAIVLECTNLCPYAAEIREHTNRPVFDITSLIAWLQSGMRPNRHANVHG